MRSPSRLAAVFPLLLAACSSDPAAPADAGTADVPVTADVPAVADTAPADERPVVMTTRGPVRGIVTDGIPHFYGIPYAAPPVGSLRWRAPEPAPMWTDPRDGAVKGAACPQAPGLLAGGSATSEDCLFLNVWALPTQSAAPRPVMVFIHGGGFNAGTGNDGQYDGPELARRNVVVVNFNYRLGQLGFLGHTALAAEDTAHHSSGNYGIMDQQAALRWVHDNIAAFGGDPANVTIFGESAGGISVCAHVTSPVSAGLFHRAITQSGPCSFLITPLRDEDARAPVQSAASQGRLFATAVGCGTATDVVACMRGKTVAEVLAAAPRPIELERYGARYQPTIDGYILTETPWTSLTSGHFNRVPFITGSNQDEGTVFTRGMTIADEAAYRAAIATLLPEHVDAVVGLYPIAAFPNALAAFTAFAGDAVFGCSSRAQARLVAATGTPAYQYYFSKLNQRANAVTMLGVYHSAEIPYVFGRFTGFFARTDADTAVANAMGTAWTRFAASGNPTADGAMWTGYTAANDSYLEFGDAIRTATGLRRERCDTLQTFISPPQ
ncbi:MAG: putative carboxylesterase [Myxococcaceae bacterium]|nr:putative carboxylesterase [Myxococcaceae bacterium]